MELVQFEKWSPDCGTCTNPNDKRNQMSDNEKLRTCRGLGSFCAILQKPIGNSQSHRREKRWYNKNHRESSIKRPDWSNIFAFYQEKKSFSANVPHLIFCQKKCRHAKCIILATAKLAQNKNLGNVSETFSCWFSGIYVIVVKDFLLIDEDEEKSLKYATDKSFRKSLKDFLLHF